MAQGRRPVTNKPQVTTLHLKVLETLSDGGKKELVLECNGTRHRQCVDIVYYNADGEVYFTDEVSKKDLGLCTCSKS